MPRPSSRVPRQQLTAGAQTAPLWYAGFIYVIFIVYGSLVPLDFHGLPLAQALTDFQHIPYLKLGIASRADWVANILLYIPLGFIGAALAVRRGQALPVAILGAAAIFLFGSALAVGVEFTQLYFPPRTVSLNDIIAEIIGTALGILFRLFAGDWLANLARDVTGGGRRGLRAVVILYVTGYLALSLFPYDFLDSTRDIGWKLANGSYGLLLANGSCESLLRCLVKLAAEVAAVVPLGILLGTLWEKRGRPHGMGRAVLVGLGLGIAIETLQFFLASGISQGLSVLTRALGVGLGWQLHRRLKDQTIGAFTPWLRPLTLIAVAPYLALVAALNGLFGAPWQGPAYALRALAGLHFLPFYYHYYTTETHALFSLLAYTAMYAPVGIGAWALVPNRPNYIHRTRAILAGFAAAFLALIMEAGKLFLPDGHADPTDLLIAWGAAWGGYHLVRLLALWLAAKEPPSAPQAARQTGKPVPPPESAPVAPTPGRPLLAAFSAALAGLILWGIADYPLGRLWAAAAVLGYGTLLWFRPRLWLVALPALLPVLDFGQWSGRIYFKEFDLLVLTTLAVGYAMLTPRRHGPGFSPGFTLLLALLALSYGISTLIGLIPLQPLDANAFSSYLSHYNALRASKGFWLALLLIPLLKAAASSDPEGWQHHLTRGLAFGAAALAAIVVWERFLFPGLFNFSSDYRVTGLFSGMQTGGPQVETFLALTLPFPLVAFLLKPSKGMLVITAMISLGTAYGMMATFSRAGYMAFALELVILGIGLVLFPRRPHFRRLPLRLAGSLLAVAVLAASVPALKGSFAESRFAQVGGDMGLRLAHWQLTLDMMKPDWLTRLFGMGTGSFPATYYAENPQGIRPGNFRYVTESGHTYLRLGGGDSLYLGQNVDTSPHTSYRLSLDIRSTAGSGGRLQIYLCEKHVLYSYRCEDRLLTIPPGSGKWVPLSLTLNSGRVGSGHWYSRRPVELSFSVPDAGHVLDIAQVRLENPEGQELVRNGDFADGGTYWFFTTDNGWPWRVENVFLQVYFEQGWLGLAAFSGLVALLVLRIFRAARRGDVFALGVGTALLGCLTVGLLSSILESPKLALLFYLLLFAGEMHLRRDSRKRRRSRKHSKGAAASGGKALDHDMDNGKQGPDFGHEEGKAGNIEHPLRHGPQPHH